MKKIGSFIIWAILCLAVETSYAELIKYTDKDGTLCFADDISTVPKMYRKNIIRTEEEFASDNPPQQQTATGNGMVQLCFYKMIEKRRGDRHDLTDFLAARNYNYRTRDVNGNPEKLKLCAELSCITEVKYQKDYSMQDCIKNRSRAFSTGQGLPLTFVGEKRYDGTMLDLAKEIDRYFNVVPNTPIQWLD